MTVQRRRPMGEAGFSLVELAVYIVIFGVISAVVVTVVISLFQSEKTVSGITNSTSGSQNMVAFLSKDIRNARQFQSSVDGTRVTASVAGADAGGIVWQCVRWSVLGTGSDRAVVRQTKSDSAGSTWGANTQLVGKVRPSGTDLFFVGSGAAGSRGSLTYSMQVGTTATGVLNVGGQLGNTEQDTGSTSACF